MATAAAASASSSLLAPAASTAPAAPNALLFPSSVPSLRAYPRLLLAFRRPAAAAVADPQGAVLEEEEVDADQRGRYDDDEDDGYEGGRGPAFTPPTRPRTGKAALPLKRDRVRTPSGPPFSYVIPFVCAVLYGR
jgi:large subunit ribosomal protein L1